MDLPVEVGMRYLMRPGDSVFSAASFDWTRPVMAPDWLRPVVPFDWIMLDVASDSLLRLDRTDSLVLRRTDLRNERLDDDL